MMMLAMPENQDYYYFEAYLCMFVYSAFPDVTATVQSNSTALIHCIQYNMVSNVNVLKSICFPTTNFDCVILITQKSQYSQSQHVQLLVVSLTTVDSLQDPMTFIHW